VPLDAAAPVPVLYISAWGRSGSTIIDNVLGGYPGVFSAGELHHLWGRGLRHKRHCGCGLPLPRCPHWRAVLDAAYGADRPNPRAVLALQRQVVRTRQTAKLWLGSPSAAAREYADLIAPLYRGLAEVTGARLVVDSSKLPAEAALLPHAPGVRPHLLHLVRDPRAVAYSWSRATPNPDRPKTMMSRHSPTVSTARWLAWNTMTEASATLAAYRGRRLRLRYEDFVAAPRDRIGEILSLTGQPDGPGPFLDERTVRLAPNHTVSGNPSRFSSGDVRIAPDDAWRRGLPLRAYVTVTALALPLLPRYGYPLMGALPA
jgi:hypothetical protein